MLTGWWSKKIYCRNCNYEGYARLKASGCLPWIKLLALFFVSFLFWPLLIVTALFLIHILLRPSRLICPKCGWEHSIPLRIHKDGRI